MRANFDRRVVSEQAPDLDPPPPPIALRASRDALAARFRALSLPR